jgi:hypothetical protein
MKTQATTLSSVFVRYANAVPPKMQDATLLIGCHLPCLCCPAKILYVDELKTWRTCVTKNARAYYRLRNHG